MAGKTNLPTKIDWSLFEDYVKTLMEKEHIAGVAVAVSQNGQIIYKAGFGVRNISTQEPVTPETIFGIASISKSFTAMAIMQLEDEGKLCVDDPVAKYIPEFKIPGVEDRNSVKIRHLLSHTTGIPPMRRRQELCTFDKHIEYLATEDYQVLGKPGEYFSYCNDAFLLLGEIIQRLTGRLYRRYMTERILDAAGMYRSTYSLEEIARFHNVSVPYIYNKKCGSLEEQPWPKLGNYEVGGGVRSNVLDLMKYAQIYVNKGVVDGKRIVSENGLKKMQEPVYKIGRNSYYGFALKITPDYCGVTLVEHGGSQPGVSSNFGFIPEKGIGAAVLTNVSNVSAQAIWLAAINTVLGLPLDQRRSVEPYYDVPFEYLKKFIGTYKSAEGGHLQVVADGDILKAKIKDEEYPLRASGEDTLVFERGGFEQVIKFYFDNEGIPWAAFLRMRMLRRVNEE